jgi:hypothetical protein
MIRLELNTKKRSDKQTLGYMDVYKDDVWQFALATLEQDWKNNEKNVSCLPAGFHVVEPHNSEKHPDSFILKGTGDRTFILIHILNFMFQTAGCIGVGLYHAYINDDKYLDLASSTAAMNKLRAVCKNEKVISIQINR